MLAEVKYVITLDSDTQLPASQRGSSLATMAHPLNRPYFDASKQRVVDGYGILQPRVAEALALSGQTRYVGFVAVNLVLILIPELYPMFTKMYFMKVHLLEKVSTMLIYSNRVLGERFPDNQILSHDLLEGCYLRSGFLSDVPCMKNRPAVIWRMLNVAFAGSVAIGNLSGWLFLQREECQSAVFFIKIEII